MIASKARELTNLFLAKKTVSRFYPAIESVANRGEDVLKLEKNEINRHEIDILTSQGYKIEKIYKDHHDPMRCDILVGYNVRW